ncbi:MAG TPA: hypothetical protein DCQ06_11010 [Myxococcales bacterium]|nr:hypothetical protein [Myxococcales bacterium]
MVSASATKGTVETKKGDKLQQQRQILRLLGTLNAKDHRRFVNARQALLAARFEQMHRELGALSDAAVNQPAPQLLSAIAHSFEDLDDQAELAMRGAAQAVQARHDALASLARLAGTQRGQGKDSDAISDQWKALDGALTNDPLARLLSLIAHPHRLSRKQVWNHVNAMRSAAAQAPIFDLYELQLHRAAGAHKTHLERASELVAASSQHPELALELARAQLRANDIEGAEKTLKPLLKMASLAPRADRIGALIALRRNDEAARMRHLLISLGDVRSDHQQHMMVRWHAVDLASHGRLKEALKLVKFCVRPSLEGAPNSAQRAAACWRAVLPYALSLQATAQSKEVLDGLRKALKLPGVHEHLAQRWRTEATVADALLSLRQGNRLPATELVVTLGDSPRRAELWLTRLRETLQSELALSDATGQASERQRAILQQHIDSQAQADVPLSCERLWSELRLAVALERKTLQSSVTKQLIDGACRGAFESWALYRAKAYRHAAESMGNLGDLKTKQAHLQALGRHWPAADIQQL